MVLVVGATGVLGSEVCKRLLAAGHRVRALVRAPSAASEALRASGAEVVLGDLRDPASLDAALDGVDAVVSTATAMLSKGRGNSLRAVDRDGQLLLVARAPRHGVRRFIYVSISPNHDERAPLMRYKREVERAIRASGMLWTIFQPSNFMEIWLGSVLGWDLAAGRAMIFGEGEAPVSWISIRDVAQYCVLALTDPRLENRDVPLGGPEALSPNTVVRILEGVAGRPFRARRVPRVILRMLSPVVALLDERQGSGMALGARCAVGDVVDSALQRELPVTRTTVKDYAERALRGAS